MLLDRDEARLGAVAEAHGGGGAETRVVDAGDGLAGAIGDCDILVNSASYRLNLAVMARVPRGGLPLHRPRRPVLAHRRPDGTRIAEFEQAGLLAILGMGSSPGKTNVMARRACRELTGSDFGPVESIDVIAGGRDLSPPDGLSAPYAVRTLVDELTMSPIVIRDGETVEIEPMASGRRHRLSRSDRPSGDDPHDPLGDADVRPELWLHAPARSSSPWHRRSWSACVS